jgi:hypothetical protein
MPEGMYQDSIYQDDESGANVFVAPVYSDLLATKKLTPAEKIVFIRISFLKYVSIGWEELSEGTGIPVEELEPIVDSLFEKGAIKKLDEYYTYVNYKFLREEN